MPRNERARLATAKRLLTSTLILSTAAGCSLKVPLVYRPTSSIDVNRFSGQLVLSDDLRLYVEPVMDGREQRNAIGENVERWEIPIYAEGMSPPDFVRQVLLKQFEEIGLNVVSDPGQANRILWVRLVKFWTRETDVYSAEVRVLVAFRDADGDPSSHLLFAGTAKRFGPSLWKPDYQKVFSDATTNLVENLLSNRAFQEGLMLE